MKEDIAILAGGCFWCTEAVFQRMDGVKEVISGYTGGAIKNPTYGEICTGKTGHAEAIKIGFDPNMVSFTSLLEVFFATHDPTTLNRQGNDVGTQYRSAIFYQNEDQKVAAENFIQFLETEKVFDTPIVTEISEVAPFYKAEQEHRDYYNLHSNQPYCQIIIDPKIKKIETYFQDRLKTTSNK